MKHEGSQLHNDVKTALSKAIHLWDAHPPIDEQRYMSASDIKAFVKAHIAAIDHIFTMAQTSMFSVVHFPLSIVLIHSIGKSSILQPSGLLSVHWGLFFQSQRDRTFTTAPIFTIVSLPSHSHCFNSGKSQFEHLSFVLSI